MVESEWGNPGETGRGRWPGQRFLSARSVGGAYCEVNSGECTTTIEGRGHCFALVRLSTILFAQDRSGEG